MLPPTTVSDERRTTVSSYLATEATTTGIVSLASVVGLVRPGRRTARSRHDRDSQAVVRRQSALRDEPAFRLDEPDGKPLRLSALGVVGCVLALAWPNRGRWVLLRFLCALTLLPALLVAVPQIYSLAWLLVALGVAIKLVPLLERHAQAFRRLVQVSLPGVVLLVAILAATPWFLDRIKLSRQIARALPPPGSPNVLLIVMDTVAAGHLSLHGYHRATSTTLVELAKPGTQFDSALALRPGPFLPTRRCSQDAGCTSCRSAGKRRSTTPSSRCPSSSAHGDTRRPASSQTPVIVPAIRG